VDTSNSDSFAHFKPYVWVVDVNSKLISRRVVTINENGMTAANVAILSGLKVGERVAVAGVHSLRDGQRVRIDQESYL
jgi:multidrug efflux pump subunit AcrA (membrane-fusion protein)